MLRALVTVAILASGPARAAIDPPHSKAERTLFSDEQAGDWAKGVWASGKSFESGVVRLRVAGRKAETELIVRSAVTGSDVRAGYAMRIRGGRLHLERIRRGKARALTPSRAFRKKKRMELVFAAFGSHLIARVYDARSGKMLAALSATDASLRSGGVAVRARKARRSKLEYQLLSKRAACRGTPKHTRKAPPLFVTAAMGDLEAVGGAKILERQPRAVARMSVPGLERLFCAKAPIRKASIDVPFKYRDADYRKWRTRSVAVERSGAPRLGASVKSPRMAHDILAIYHRRHPTKTRLVDLDHTSHRERRILALVVGDHVHTDKSVPSFLVVGAHHGNEPSSVDFVLDAARRLLEVDDDKARRWRASYEIWFIPVANPDGLHAFLETSVRMGRKNGREQDGQPGHTDGDGVDLNRNYPFRWGALGEKGSKSRKQSPWYRGPEPASEPETKAIMALADRERFAGVLTYHGGTVALLAPYTIDGVKNPVSNEAWTVAEKLVDRMPDHPQGKGFRVRDKLYSVDGTDQDWHRFEHGTVALLVEGARRTPRTEAGRLELQAAVLPLFEGLLEQFRAASIRGTVVDAEGHPVTARVNIAQIGTVMGERWTTRCPDGRFDRFVPDAGKFDVLVRVGDDVAAQRVVRVNSKTPELRIQLDRAYREARCAPSPPPTVRRDAPCD